MLHNHLRNFTSHKPFIDFCIGFNNNLPDNIYYICFNNFRNLNIQQCSFQTYT